MPEYFNFNQTQKGYFPIQMERDGRQEDITITYHQKAEGSSVKEQTYTNTYNYREDILHFYAKGIPAFPIEKYLRTKDNYLSKVEFELNTGFKNYMFEEIFGLLNLSKKEQKDALIKGFSAEGVSIIDFSVEELPGSTAQGSLKVRGDLSQYATKIGARLIFTPEYFFSNNVMSCIPNNRELDLYQPLGFLHIDTLRVSIPDNYQVEYLPKGKQLTSIYGEYSLAVENSGQMITIVRELKINEGKYIRPLFNEINKFLCSISYCDNEKIIAIRK